MKIKACVAGALSLLAVGCTVYEVPTSTTVIIEERRPYVNSHVYIPDHIAAIIEDRVAGYRMPPVSRYGKVLYPSTYRDSYNLPCYIKSDFNGDGIEDYAFMFSRESWTCCDWSLTTRMLIVASNYSGGYRLALDLILGTVTAPSSTPMEEYWGIRLLRRGTHTIGTYRNGVLIEEKVVLPNDGIYLASLDPAERSVFTLAGTSVSEMVFDMGSIAKRQEGVDTTSRASRVIRLGGSAEK